MKNYGCQQNLINPNPDSLAILEFLCEESNKLHNCGVYLGRQLWFKGRRYLKKFDLNKLLKNNNHYRVLYSQVAQQLLLSVTESFKSYYELQKQYHKKTITDKPRPPKYRKKGGFCGLTYPKQALKLRGNQIRLPLGKTVTRWFGLSEFFLPMPTNLSFSTIKELRIVPRNRLFYVEYVYEKEIVMQKNDPEKVLAMDHGIGNALSCVTNIGKSIIIDGKKAKSLNQWYNKKVAKLKEGKPQGFWSDDLARTTEIRNRQMRDFVNKSARYIVNFCRHHRIGTIVFGWNQGQKQSVNIGKKNNQSFVQIPMGKIKDRIHQLCDEHGLKFVELPEAYTSKSSFLDNDLIPNFGEKPEGYQFSGKRIKRGLYRSKQGFLVNGDVMAAANILRKYVSIQPVNISLAKVSRAVLTLPQRINIFNRGFKPIQYSFFESPLL
ncbi:transposase [Cyanobacterium aponinum UTEX 3222]|uniref:RNA-guided endonuclease InsQ/TnpB family protein n=1 Tax=Cyanobacterium aponinum TaxID=379064 RepID=UPI003088A4C0|nr:transposase [Cyanobacterium aponinum UTEX 3222]